MFTFSNRSSRSSSAHSLNNLLGEDEPPAHFNAHANESVYMEDDRSSDIMADAQPPELSEDNNLNPAIQVTFTQNHPMGKILIGLLKDTFQLAKKTNVKEMESDLNEMCTNFYNAMRLGQTSTKRQIKHAAMNLEEQLIEKELNSHLLNENTDPPKYFSPIPTLLTPHQRNEAMKCFPTRSPRFAGNSNRENGMDIIEFLSALKTAQEYCKLSEREFKQFLLLCTTGRAHTLLMEWLSLEESIPTIFHSLLMHFDKRITPEASKELLFTYKAPKNLSLKEVETNIMLWVSRAAAVLPAGPSRIAYYNMEIIQTLIRSLPPMSSARVQSVFNTLSARLGRAAQATELSRALNIDRHAIDADIRQNGVDKNFKYPSTMQQKPRRVASYAVSIPVPSPAIQNNNNNNSYYNKGGTPVVNSTRSKVYNTTATTFPFRGHNNARGHQNKNSANQRQHNVRPNASQGAHAKTNFRRGNFRSNNQSKIHGSNTDNYCSLCGKNDHLASQGCPYMMYDTGVTAGVMPTHSICAICPASVRPRLNHPAAFCPYRKAGPFAGSQ